MLRIVRVGALDGETLDIELNNGSLVLLNLSSLMQQDPAFSELRGQDRFLCPVTDGQCVHWRDGPRLGLDEIFRLLGCQEGE